MFIGKFSSSNQRSLEEERIFAKTPLRSIRFAFKLHPFFSLAFLPDIPFANQPIALPFKFLSTRRPRGSRSFVSRVSRVTRDVTIVTSPGRFAKRDIGSTFVDRRESSYTEAIKRRIVDSLPSKLHFGQGLGQA